MENSTVQTLEARKAFCDCVVEAWLRAALSQETLVHLLGTHGSAQVSAYLKAGVVLPIGLVHDLALALKVEPATLLDKYLAAFQPDVHAAIGRACGGLSSPDMARALDAMLPTLPPDQEYILWDLQTMKAAAMLVIAPKLNAEQE